MRHRPPEVEKLEARLKRYDHGRFKSWDYFDYWMFSFDVYLIREATHLEDSDIKDVMRTVQTRGACLFFLMIHVPLSRIHSLFSLVSCLFPMALSLKAKYYVYERTNDAVVALFFWDQEAKNHVVKPIELCYERKELSSAEEHEIILNKDEQTSQESAVFATMVYLGLYFTLTINYILSVFGQEIIVDTCAVLIRAADKSGIADLHFLRYLHLSLFSTRPHAITIYEIEDILMLAFIITPLFILAMRYWTAPSYLNYRLRANALALPLAVLPMLWGHHRDINILALAVGFMNYSAFWGHAGSATQNLYQLANQRIRGRKVKLGVHAQLDKRELRQFGKLR